MRLHLLFSGISSTTFSRHQRSRTVMRFWTALLCSLATLPSKTTSLQKELFSRRQLPKSVRGITSSVNSQAVHAKDHIASSDISAAELVARATSFEDVIAAADTLIYPGEEKLHYQTQTVHQRKRQKVATNALKRLVKFLIGISVSPEKQDLINSEKFYRLCVCATASINEKFTPGGDEAYWQSQSDITSFLEAVYCLGALAPLPTRVTADAVHPLLIQLDSIFARHRNSKAAVTDQLPINFIAKPTDISSIEWAIQRISSYNSSPISASPTVVNIDKVASPSLDARHILARRKELQLPFQVLHGIVKGVTSVEEMRKMVPFKAETLQTRDGKLVSERRETCWMADEGIGGLAYSGKIMAPVPFTANVAKVRDIIEKETGIYYDCCLINWYDDGECACKFHSDPDHGRLWSHDTVVVSIGETRRFNLREIPQTNPVQQAAVKGKGAVTMGGSKAGEAEQEHHSFHLFDGDVFYMTDDCQDTFQHCVMKSEGEANNSPRSSIVFKKSLPGPGGRRGHGLVKAKGSDGERAVSSSKFSSDTSHVQGKGSRNGSGGSAAPARPNSAKSQIKPSIGRPKANSPSTSSRTSPKSGNERSR